VVLRDPAGKVVLELAKNIGRETNNVAEYYALLAALDAAGAQGVKALRVRSDSELLVRQMQGRYKVKSPELKPLHERATKLARQFQYFTIEHVPREMNRDADGLANVALDQAGVAKFESRGEGRTPSNPAAARAATTRRIRARFTKGAFLPIHPGEMADLRDLAEGAEVFLDVRIPLKE
jgi:ribonuclease HI